MKSILLTTTAIVAFAGAAAADGHAGISFSGSATLGYNSSDSADVAGPGDNDGFYADMNLDVSMVAALDNGITVTATADVDELDASDWQFDGVTLEIASEMASLTFGDTDTSADLHWSGVDGDTTAGFNDRDHYLDDNSLDAILRGEATFGGVTASMSYAVETNDGAGMDFIDGLQVAAVADLGGFTVVGAYQGETDGTGEYGVVADAVMGLSVAGAFSGVDVMGSYLSDGTETSIGVSASAPVGPVTLGGYYSANEVGDNMYGLDVSYSDGPISVSADFDTDDNDATDPTWEVDANYDTGLGAIVHAGMTDSGEDMYVAVTYDLGGGASLLASYADDGDGDAGDEVGEDDLQHGMTVEVSFSF